MCLLATVCPVSSDPFHIASLLYKMGHYFLDILYIICQEKKMLQIRFYCTHPKYLKLNKNLHANLDPTLYKNNL